MTEQEIRDNAPDGATHYRYGRSGSPIYYKSNGTFIMMWCHDRWINTGRCDFDNLKPLP